MTLTTYVISDLEDGMSKLVKLTKSQADAITWFIDEFDEQLYTITTLEETKCQANFEVDV